MAKAAVRSKAVVLLLLMYCFIYLPLFVGALYSVAVDLLRYVPPIVCGGSVFVFVLVCITLYPL